MMYQMMGISREFHKLQEASKILNNNKKYATYDDVQQVQKLHMQKEGIHSNIQMKVNLHSKKEGTRRKPKSFKNEIGQLNAWLGNFVKSFRIS